MRYFPLVLLLSAAMFGCGAHPDAEGSEPESELDSTSESLEVPCRAFNGVQHFAGPDYIVCPTRGFDITTWFAFFNDTSGQVAVRLKSGWDEQLVMLPPQKQATMFPHKYYGGYVKIWVAAPEYGSIGVAMW